MTVFELTRDQMTELKCNLFIELYDGISTDEMARINELVSDLDLYESYDKYYFTNDDFFCSMDK